MANIFDYLTDVQYDSFYDLPLNELDVLALTELTYLSFDHLLDQPVNRLSDVATRIPRESTMLTNKERLQLLDQLSQHKRFKNSIFCKIIAGEIPASKVYEDDQVLAFLDISQVTPGHTLVVPKEHYRNLLEMDATSASQLFAQVPKIAQKVMKATKAEGMNIIANCEEVAGQTVFHTHVHLVPRYSADDDLKIDFIAHEPDFDKLAQVAETIKNA